MYSSRGKDLYKGANVRAQTSSFNRCPSLLNPGELNHALCHMTAIIDPSMIPPNTWGNV